MHYKKILVIIISIILIVLLNSCADAIQYQYAVDIKPVGFWYGLWHGIIAPISFIISLFDAKVAIYAVYNSGGWYNFGYIIGLSISMGGSCTAANKKGRFWKK
jgi:hypothetical protein